LRMIDGVTLELFDNRIVRLEGLGAPRAPARAGSDTNWPIENRAREYAGAIVTGQRVDISSTDQPDRYGRVIGQVFLADGTWVNGALVRGGMARVETQSDQTRCASEALMLEDIARTGTRGMWALSAYAIHAPEESAGFTNDFQIVEGMVVSVAEVRGRIYLNFGEDYRTDFTVTIAPSDMRRFEAVGLDPLSLVNARIRVRGWLEFFNGPMIEASHPEQLELLESEL